MQQHFKLFLLLSNFNPACAATPLLHFKIMLRSKIDSYSLMDIYEINGTRTSL